MKRFMFIALAAAMFTTTACGGDPCKEVLAKACEGVKDCSAFSKTFEEGMKKAGDAAKDACKAQLGNEEAMKGLNAAAKATSKAAEATKK